MFQCCYSLIDSLLEGTDLTGNITQALDVILCPDVSLLQVQSYCHPFSLCFLYMYSVHVEGYLVLISEIVTESSHSNPY